MTTYKTLPYVYICYHKDTRHFYIGYREGNKVPSSQDLPLYKTSSKQVKPNFDQYEWQILAEFFDSDDAYNFEQFLIYENWDNPLLINKSCYHNKRQFRKRMDGSNNSMYGKNHNEETKQKCQKRLLVTKEGLGSVIVKKQNKKCQKLTPINPFLMNTNSNYLWLENQKRLAKKQNKK